MGYKKGHPNYLKHHTEEAKRKISIAGIGRKSSLRGKTYEEIYGTEKAFRMREKRRVVMVGNKNRLGQLVSAETREKHRIATLGRIEEIKRKFAIARQEKKRLFGYVNSPEMRRKLSLALKGKPNGRKGTKLSEETRRKIGESQRGNKSVNWKGGISPINKIIRKSIDYRLWREAVFARDNWTCQKCGQRGGELHPHHIKNFSDFPELRFAIDNGITLCKGCHREFHNKYGGRNNTERQLEEFIQTK